MEKSHEQIAAELCQAFTLDYQGAAPNVDSEGEFDIKLAADIDRMVRHPVVAEALRIQEAGIASADFICSKASSSEVEAWALKSLKHFWEHDLYKIQLSYRRGWIGGEILYREQGGMLNQVGVRVFHWRDTWPVLFNQTEYAGFRVKRLKQQGSRVLRCADRWPGKAFWHAHDQTTDRFAGNGLLVAAHRDWQRLAERQGAEPILDLAMTRTGVAGPEFHFDPTSFPVRQDNGQLDYEVVRNSVRQMVADWQAGMALMFPSKFDERGNQLWSAKWPDKTLDAGPLLDVMKHYESRICYAIGTPRELMESIETGGYAGRNITMETFLSTQQRYARQICQSWVEQVGLPLCRFHFGPEAFFSLELIPLNESRAQQQGAPGQQMPGQQPIGNAPPPTATHSLPGKQPAQPPAKMLASDRFFERKIKSSRVLLQSEFHEEQHPRATDGKWKGKGGSSGLSEKSAKRYKPKPEDWGAPIIPGRMPKGVWNVGTSGGYARAKPLIEEARRLYANPKKVTLDEVKAFAQKILATPGRDALYTLAVAAGIKTGTSKAIAERLTEGLTKEDLQLEEVDQTKEQAITRQVKEAGGTAKDAKQVTAYARQLRDEGNKHIDYRNDAVKYAYHLLSIETGKPFTKNHPAFNGGDYNDVTGTDTIAREVNNHYPGLFGEGRNAKHEGNVPDAEYDLEKFWEMLSEGMKPRLTIADTSKQAIEEWEQSGKKKETPF